MIFEEKNPCIVKMIAYVSLSYQVTVIQCHVINNVITTRNITLSAGTSSIMMTSLQQIFIEINKL